ncbi:hypothetical protein [Lewinella sp. IMCC34183]|uniref:hypothetical protein n=1 Tax=Lewinella sp. IMCC34183 TaxID=2248762 RepID=UPI00130072BF|nr:hypothetical protein [Lewinella sp. IMCC34183]
MATDSFRFRWWYLLFLLPVVLYVGARWYVGHRIDRAIASANDSGNVLAVADYDYSLFPIALSARGIRFEQDRPAFAARGSLSRLRVSGLEVFSLIGSDPIALNRIELSGMDADVTRKPVQSNDSSSLKLEVSAIDLDSIFLRIEDAANGTSLRLADLGLSLESFHLPFQPTGIRSLRITADSATYRKPADDLSVIASELTYAQADASTRLQRLVLSRGGDTRVEARDVAFTGLNAEDVDDQITLDSLTIGYLGGGARVPGGSGEAQDTSGSGMPALRVNRLHLPDIDLRVSGGFGTADYAGSLRVTGVTYRDSLTAERLEVAGDSIRYDNGKDLAVLLHQLQLEQQDLRLPFAGGSLGPTDIRIPDFSVDQGARNITGRELVYRSTAGDLRIAGVTVTGGKVEGQVDSLFLTGIQRDALLGPQPSRAGQLVAVDARTRINRPDGGHYTVHTPRLVADGLRFEGQAGAERIRMENASFERFGSDGRKDMEGTGIYVDQRTVRQPFEPKTFGPAKARLARLRMIGGNDLPVDYVFNAVAYDSRAGRLTLDSLRRVNRITPGELFDRELAKSFLTFDIDGLRATGIRHDALVTGELIYLDSLEAQDMRLSVIEDLSLTLPDRKKAMPIEALRKIGPRVVLQNARFKSTDISYGVVDSILEPKTIHFRDAMIRIAGLDTEVSQTDSATAVIDATFEGTTPLHAEFRLARSAGGRDYAATGELGKYDLSRVNPLMRVAADAIIDEGVIERLTYRSLMQNDTVTGTMDLVYRNLDLKVVGNGAWIKNLLSGVVVKNDNLRGEDFREGQIFSPHDPTKSFFNSYWKGLVSGMKSSAMSDIALPEELD